MRIKVSGRTQNLMTLFWELLDWGGQLLIKNICQLRLQLVWSYSFTFGLCSLDLSHQNTEG